ncbi:hypothetical protein [Rubrolithibacter danxiaensis]|uniref:hypothetical protein n=1 Tax=Rubrolithibacter danxiaensis TaxID=3390805 RepID=UPI003BF7D34A
MDTLAIQVMLKDGSVTDYEVRNERDGETYEVLQNGKSVALFQSEGSGWKMLENPENIDTDLRDRIMNQLNGLRR